MKNHATQKMLFALAPLLGPLPSGGMPFLFVPLAQSTVCLWSHKQVDWETMIGRSRSFVET